MKEDIIKYVQYLFICAILGLVIIILLKVSWLENDLIELDKIINKDVTNRLIELKFMIMEDQRPDTAQIFLYGNTINEYHVTTPTIVQTVKIGTPYTIIEGAKIIYFVEDGKVVFSATPDELGMK